MNFSEIRKSIEIFKDNGLTEIRIIRSDNKVLSGYFDNPDEIIDKIKGYDNQSCQIYFVFNKIKEACKDRLQYNSMELSKNTTSDGDIEARTWVLIDVDPERPSGVSSTDEEKKMAKSVIDSIYKYLNDVGFSKPVICDSGNGYHLMYRVQLSNSDKFAVENTELVKRFLETLDFMFSMDGAKVDTSVFNAARITKLYGTIAKKGKSSDERPHRESRICYIPDKIEPTKSDLLKKVCDELPEQSAPSYRNNYNQGSFDLEAWLNKYNIEIERKEVSAKGTKYILKHCVFDPAHEAPDAMIFQMSNGAIGYKCFHAHCQGYTWHDVRLKFEPDAYSKERNFDRFRGTAPVVRQDEAKHEDKEPEKEIVPWFETKDIENVDRSKITAIPSGFSELDKKIIGFNLGELSIWSGCNGSGKSSILSMIALNAAQKGFKTAMFSGEMTGKQVKNWLMLQSAGRQNIIPSDYYPNAFYVRTDIVQLIDNWLSGKIYIYNNDVGTSVIKLIEEMQKLMDEKKVDQFILDNLMALDLSDYNFDTNGNQKETILSLNRFAEKNNVHIHIICHPRKTIGFLRKYDISGTSDLTNLAHNVFIVHRVNTDFLTTAKEYLGAREVGALSSYANVIEICKNRDLGVMDQFVGLYFEQGSKRFLNDQIDNPLFDWQEHKSEEITDDDDLPF